MSSRNKKKKHNTGRPSDRRKPAVAPLNNGSIQDAPPSKPEPGRNRIWLFRVCAAVGVPLVLLILIEVALRALGMGYPTAFFLKRDYNNREYWTDNERFGLRFFSREILRMPYPNLVDLRKREDTYRVVVLGGSAAMGDPEPSYGFARQLELILDTRFPDRDFEVVNAAITAINSHVVREIAEDCEEIDADFWMVYMGNNEVVGPYGAGTVFSSQTPALSFIRANLILKKLRFGQALEAVIRNLFRQKEYTDWGGMEMFIEQQVPHNDERLDAVYEYFKANLEDIINSGLDSGAEVILSTVAVNLADCPPFSSTHSRNLTQSQITAFEKHLNDAAAGLDAGHAAAALDDINSALALDPAYADAQFIAGKCHEKLGNTEKARECYQKALDYDTLRFRTDSRLNGIIRNTFTNKYKDRVRFIDAEAALARNSENRITGGEFLYEHVHFNFEGAYLMAKLIAEKIDSLLPSSVERNDTTAGAPYISKDECAARLAYTPFDRHRTYEMMLDRFTKPPFTAQLRHAAFLEAWEEKVNKLEPQTKPGALRRSAGIYESAISDRPEDWQLHFDFARLLQNAGNIKEAAAEFDKTSQLMPFYAEPLFQSANIYSDIGEHAKAAALYTKAAEYKPSSFEIYNGLGLAFMARGEFKQAIKAFEKVIELRPRFTEAYSNLGLAYSRMGDTDRAEEYLRTAISKAPKSYAAHINLGKLMAQENKLQSAAELYRQAIKIQPSRAAAYFNLANTYSALGRYEDTVSLYSNSVTLNPGMNKARYNLAMELTKLDRLQEAVHHLSEVVRSDPDNIEARLNLGVALIKTGHTDAAVRMFREILRLQPNNKEATKYLESALAADD
ncbi:MAG: tetratricopeptide repeat protein [Verrucomicrobia bacterium]|nr:tetratricopeptide repeat protein [Verrucomicrobiota bacterium]